MKIDITRFFNEAEAFDFSASQSELGENAGRITWGNAVEEAESSPLLTTPEQLEAMRGFAKDSGYGTEGAIAEWSDADVNALFIQLISGAMREIEDLCTTDDGETDWEEYQNLSEKGTISGRLFKSGETIYYELES